MVQTGSKSPVHHVLKGIEIYWGTKNNADQPSNGFLLSKSKPFPTNLPPANKILLNSAGSIINYTSISLRQINLLIRYQRWWINCTINHIISDLGRSSDLTSCGFSPVTDQTELHCKIVTFQHIYRLGDFSPRLFGYGGRFVILSWEDSIVVQLS